MLFASLRSLVTPHAVARASFARFSSSLANLSAEEVARIKQRARWAQEHLAPHEIPKTWLDVSFARSGGPGGQNVNKVNTKAEIRLDLNKATSGADAVVEKMPRSAVQHLTKSSVCSIYPPLYWNNLLTPALSHITKPRHIRSSSLPQKRAARPTTLRMPWQRCVVSCLLKM